MSFASRTYEGIYSEGANMEVYERKHDGSQSFKSQNVFVEDLPKDQGILMAGNKEGLIATNSKVHVKEASQLVVYVLALFWVQMANLSGGSYLKSKKLPVCVLELGCGASATLELGRRCRVLP